MNLTESFKNGMRQYPMMEYKKWAEGEPGIILDDRQKHTFWHSGSQIGFSEEFKKLQDRETDPRPELSIIRYSYDQIVSDGTPKCADYQIFLSEDEAIKWWMSDNKSGILGLKNMKVLIVLYHGYLSYNSFDIIPTRVDEHQEFIEVIDWREHSVDDYGIAITSKPGIYAPVSDGVFYQNM